jgi:SAM-dependent methyltransferase
MNKLNFGCGARITEGWTNIDFHSIDKRVQRVNLLAGFPFPENHFDVVYSSHVLEHFTADEARFLLREAWRVLKVNGIIRTVVPDLKETIREYLRILDLPDSDEEKQKLYAWIMIELLDQLVRSSQEGTMGRCIRAVVGSGDTQMVNYIRSRTECAGWITNSEIPKSLSEKLKGMTREKLLSKITYLYLGVIKRLIPKHIRTMVVNNATIGERHRWMYDRYGLSLLMKETGFVNISFRHFNESTIAGFAEEHLDSNKDGSPYKNVSIYCEARKGGDLQKGDDLSSENRLSSE